MQLGSYSYSVAQVTAWVPQQCITTAVTETHDSDKFATALGSSDDMTLAVMRGVTVLQVQQSYELLSVYGSMILLTIACAHVCIKYVS